MNLREEILKEHSRAQSEKIAKWIGRDAKRFDELMQLFLDDEYRGTQRAAWVLSVVAEKHYKLVIPYIESMVKRAAEPGVPDAVKRNVVRVLQFMDIPEALHGDVMNLGFDLLSNPNEPVAVRCFSMTVLGNLSKTYPDIKQELKAVIADMLEQEPSAGMKARAKKVLSII
jgi:hypothetical protein